MRTCLRLFTIAVFALITSTCSSSRVADVERGTDYRYKPGHPEFRINTFGFVDEEKGPLLDISAEIVKGSLVYSGSNDSLTAHFAVTIQITDLDNPENMVENQRFERTVRSSDKTVSAGRDIVEIRHRLQVEPSNYRITISVEDLNSKRKLTQTAETYIPETEEGQYTLSSIQMYGKQSGDNEWNLITGYDVQSKMDSLRFVFQIISPQTGRPLTLNTQLLQFASDTAYPRSMTRNNYSPSSIEYKGIDFDRHTAIESNRRILTDYGSVFVEYRFANRDRGNYRFEVTAQKEGDEDELFKARAFGVKSENYPAIKSARELARPLIYLMGENEYEQMLAIDDPDSLKQAVDRFWLKNIGNRQRARRVIELYYTRVEQANKQFSNFKEGWKTDRGMIYILFGEPFYERDRLKLMVWYYSYNLEDPEHRFVFDQPKLNNKFYPFDHYILDRQNYYHSIRYNQRELWLSGRILSRRVY